MKHRKGAGFGSRKNFHALHHTLECCCTHRAPVLPACLRGLSARSSQLCRVPTLRPLPPRPVRPVTRAPTLMYTPPRGPPERAARWRPGRARRAGSCSHTRQVRLAAYELHCEGDVTSTILWREIARTRTHSKDRPCPASPRETDRRSAHLRPQRRRFRQVPTRPSHRSPPRSRLPHNPPPPRRPHHLRSVRRG